MKIIFWRKKLSFQKETKMTNFYFPRELCHFYTTKLQSPQIAFNNSIASSFDHLKIKILSDYKYNVYNSVITYCEWGKGANLVAVASNGLSDVAGLDGIAVSLHTTGRGAL